MKGSGAAGRAATGETKKKVTAGLQPANKKESKPERERRPAGQGTAFMRHNGTQAEAED